MIYIFFDGYSAWILVVQIVSTDLESNILTSWQEYLLLFLLPKEYKEKSNKTSQNTWNMNYGRLSHLYQGVYKWKVFHFTIHQQCLIEWLFWPQLCFRIKDIIQVVNTVAVALNPWERLWEFL